MAAPSIFWFVSLKHGQDRWEMMGVTGSFRHWMRRGLVIWKKRTRGKPRVDFAASPAVRRHAVPRNDDSMQLVAAVGMALCLSMMCRWPEWWDMFDASNETITSMMSFPFRSFFEIVIFYFGRII